jgi:cytochrome c oxidase assembly protein subunit 15
MMDGNFIPDGYLAMKPVWLNAFENVAAIQFNHRVLAYIILAFAVWVWSSVRRRGSDAIKRSSNWLLAALVFQALLGIVTLLKIVEFPYALSHQAGAIMVFLFALAATRNARIRQY